jgi:hypothetical protein
VVGDGQIGGGSAQEVMRGQGEACRGGEARSDVDVVAASSGDGRRGRRLRHVLEQAREV